MDTIRRSCSVSGSLASTRTTATSARSSAPGGTQRRVEVRALVLPGPPPDPGGVHEPPGHAAQFDELVHRVPGGAGAPRPPAPAARPASRFSRLDLPTLGWPISATRRGPPPASDGSGGASGQRVEHHVEQVTAAPAVQGADRVAARRGPRDHSAAAAGSAGRVVHLVRGDHDRLAGPAQHRRDGLVGVGHPDHGVHHEQHRVRRVHRQPGLGGHLLGQRAAGVGAVADGRPPSHRCPPG